MLSDIRGPIVQRDLTVSNDNGTRIFSPRTTIGSLTLAQPGQIAELDFVTTDTVRVGTRVVIGMLLDEINATMADPVAPPTKILINHQLSPPTIFIKYTYWNNEGETAASLALKTVREDIEIAGPPAIAGALGYNVYTGATEDACRLQQHVTGFGNSGGIAFAFAPQPLAPIMNSEFEQIKRSRQDPPLLPPSRSLYNDRYYLAQNQTPTFCRHLQIQFAWADEAAANELLTYTIFGAIYQEGRTA
jgi:hypothetical protein